MLPTSKEYLTRAGFSPSASAYILIGLFLTGVIVIQVTSGFIHRFIPSHVVDCAHSHGASEEDPERGEGHAGSHEHHHHETNGHTEHTPLLRPQNSHSFKSTPAVLQRTTAGSNAVKEESLRDILGRRISALMGGVKPLCDEDGPCYGFSQTCGRECTKVPGAKTTPPPTMSTNEVIRPTLPQHQSTVQLGSERRIQAGSTIENYRTTSDTGYFDAVASQHPLHGTTRSASSSKSQLATFHSDNYHQSDINHDAHADPDDDHHDHHDHHDAESSPKGGETHHHHVPQNAFLSIGLQTSVAIALHKLPEGFITYATNHASPTLGLTVFLALFIHNIVEGFAMALPLYLALSSRWKAMFWSSLLGGISQPAGAGLAALWIWSSGHAGSDSTGPSWGVYGGMFAATSGVMTSVALQLFSEGLGLTHRRGMGIAFAVAGMGLMGLSFALTA